MRPAFTPAKTSPTGLSAWRCASTAASARDCLNLCHEFSGAEIRLPIRYDDIEIESGYRADIIVRGEVILELKAVEQISTLHEAQLLRYLRLSSCRVGLLINFDTLSLIDGLRRRML